MPVLVDLGAAAPRAAAPPTPRAPGVAGPAARWALRVAPSIIHGLGVFAAEPIAAGRKIGEIRGEAIDAAEAGRRARARSTLMLIALSARRVLDAAAAPDDNPLRHANHACAPSAVLRLRQGRVEVYAIRALAAGAEITVAYGATHHRGRLACRCGAARCAGWL